MNYLYSLLNNVKYCYNFMNPTMLSGAIDVIVVEQPDGSLLSTPFHVRFGKWAVFNIDEKFVDIEINDHFVDSVKMKLSDNGVAFFVEEIEGDVNFPDYLIASPLQTTLDNDEKRDFDKQKTSKRLDDRRSQRLKALSKRSTSFPKNECAVEPSTFAGNNKSALPSILAQRKCYSLPDLSDFSAQQCQHNQKPDCKVQLDDPRRETQLNDQFTSNARSDATSSTIETLKQQLKRRSTSSVSVSEDKFEVDRAEKPLHLMSLADRALSDSEVDRQQYDQLQDNTEWKWGEYPECKHGKEKPSMSKQKDPPEVAETSGAWSWFGWRSPTTPKEKGVYLDGLTKKEINQLGRYLTSIRFNFSEKENDRSSLNDLQTSTPAERDQKEENKINQMLTIDTTGLVKNEIPVISDIFNKMRKESKAKEELLTSPNYNDPLLTLRSDVEMQHDLASSNVSLSSTSEHRAFSLSEPPPSIKGVRYKRTLRLRSNQLKNLNLRYGSNNAKFSISTKIQGTAWCVCQIYLLKWFERIVISDVDGTITKSDVLGHIIPAIGGSWAHTSIVDLYRRIQNNGYRIVYLSSRAIGQSYQTKKYLSSVIQDSKKLPDGPVLLSPTSVLMAFRKEVIERKPEEFKIACLTDLLSLFPAKHPFYAGFGNRDTDVKSYVAVGIPVERILIINPTGSVENAVRNGFKTNYDTMLKTNLVDCLFPPLTTKNLDANSKFNTTYYWKSPAISIDDSDLESYEQNQKEQEAKRQKLNVRSMYYFI